MDIHINALNQNHAPVNLYLHLLKAFESLGHTILLFNFMYYGFENNVLMFLHGHLSCRTQYVQLDDSRSI